MARRSAFNCEELSKREGREFSCDDAWWLASAVDEHLWLARFSAAAHIQGCRNIVLRDNGRFVVLGLLGSSRSCVASIGRDQTPDWKPQMGHFLDESASGTVQAVSFYIFYQPWYGIIFRLLLDISEFRKNRNIYSNFDPCALIVKVV
jgi:hypothetical protein